MKKIFLILIGVSISLYANFTRDDISQIVTDHTTGLQWQDDNASETTARVTWEDAIDYCESLELSQNSDWRLPNFNELYFLTNRAKKNPALNNIFKNIVTRNDILAFYWSSTAVVGTESSVWSVEFYYGYFSGTPKNRKYWVRCVRNY